MYWTRLAMEAGCVGVVLAFALVLGSRFYRPSNVSEMLLYGFCLGVLIHLGFEMAGLNRLYCTSGAACLR
jgi:hypothetical protein